MGIADFAIVAEVPRRHGNDGRWHFLIMLKKDDELGSIGEAVLCVNDTQCAVA